VLLEHLRRTQSLTDAARLATQILSDARRDLDQLAAATSRTVPAAARWTEEQLTRATDDLRGLGVDAALATGARARAGDVAAAAAAVTIAVTELRGVVERAGDAVAGRYPVDVDIEEGYRGVDLAIEHLGLVLTEYSQVTTGLRTAVDTATRDHATLSGLREVAQLLDCRAELIADILTEATRQQAIRRLNTADKAPATAAGAILDTRFTQMSDTIPSGGPPFALTSS
jgi:hypothetical protein